VQHPAGSHTGNGIGRRGSTSGTTCDNVVVNVAVQDAPAVAVAPTGVHVAGVPSDADPFMNCTVPLGTFTLLLFDETVAVSVTLVPFTTLVAIGLNVVVVTAFVTVSVLVVGAAGGE
jgi:hypothetical protein